MKKKPVVKREQYIKFPYDISRTELEAHLGRKLTSREFADYKYSLGDYLDWDQLDFMLTQAIDECEADFKKMEEEDNDDAIGPVDI